MKRLTAGIAVWFMVSAAQAAEADRVSLTIYNDNLALVEHQRSLALQPGRQRIEFKGVSAGIVPETVSIGSAAFELLEQNYDYDLLTPAKLLDKAVGEKVRIVRVNPGTGAETAETARVLSTNNGTVLDFGTRIEVLREDNLPTRVLFDKVPESLRASPTLSILAEVPKAVNDTVTLTYLSRGLSWRADYVIVFDEAARKASAQGWITLRNTSGSSFGNAQTRLVAGNVNLAGSADDWRRRADARNRAVARPAGVESNPAEPVADYYLYSLPQRTDIANNQTKQVSFLTAPQVAADKVYEIRYFNLETAQVQPVDVRVRFSNARAAGLGQPLPSGVVRVYSRDQRGQPQFIGEDLIAHTSAGSEIAVKTGEAFDVTAEATALKKSRVNARTTDTDMTYQLRNARAQPVTVTLRIDGLLRNNEVLKESVKGRRAEARAFAWDVVVPANGESTLAVTLRNGW